MSSLIKTNSAKTAIGIFFILALILPLITMFSYIRSTDIISILSSERFVYAFGNSITVAITSTVISVLLSFVLAWIVSRSGIRYKALFGIIFTLPMLIPSVSHGMGLKILLGTNGILTNLLHLDFSIYGFVGIVLGSVMYSFPVAFLMIVDILKYEDYTAYEAANVLGIPKIRQLISITLPYLSKPLISVVFATFTLVLTDYGVPMMIGGKYITLPVMMIQDVIGLLDFGKGSVIGIVLLIPALGAFLFDIFASDKGTPSFVVKQTVISKNKVRDILSYFVCGVICIFVIFPIFSFAILTFIAKYPTNMTFTLNNIIKSMDIGVGRFFTNSLLIALATSIFGVIISYIVAYITSRLNGKASRILHLISITSLAVPGLVLGLSYVLFFKNSSIYGTILILILVNMVHFFASPYLMAYNSFHKVNENLEDVGATLGINRIRIIINVLIPQMKMTIIEMFSFFFVNAMITISAVSFLSNIRNMPISLMIPQFEAQMLLEYSAFVSLIILGVNLLIKGIVYILKKRFSLDSGIM